jgi:hypothetical protein
VDVYNQRLDIVGELVENLNDRYLLLIIVLLTPPH